MGSGWLTPWRGLENTGGGLQRRDRGKFSLESKKTKLCLCQGKEWKNPVSMISEQAAPFTFYSQHRSEEASCQPAHHSAVTPTPDQAGTSGVGLCLSALAWAVCPTSVSEGPTVDVQPKSDAAGELSRDTPDIGQTSVKSKLTLQH